MTQPPVIEQEIIGALLNDPAQWFAASEILKPSSFSHPVTGDAFRAIGECARRGEVTAALVEGAMRKEMDGITVGAFLEALQASDAGITILSHALVIREAADLRALRKAVAGLPEAMAKAGESAAEIRTALVDILQAAAPAVGPRQSSSLSDLIQRAAERVVSGKGSGFGAITTGLDTLDRMTGPWLPGELVVIGADSGSGKTALAMQVANHVAATRPVEFFQIEMSEEQIGLRELAAAGVSSRSLREGNLTAEEAQRVLEYAETRRGSRMHVTYQARIRVSEIRTRCLARKAEEGDLALVLVDHSKLVGVDGRVDNRIERIARVYEELKALSKELGCPIVVLSQLTRRSREGVAAAKRIQDVRPSRDGLYGGGDPVEFADIVLLLHQPARTWRRCEPLKKGTPEHDAWALALDHWEGKGEVILDKFRGGAEGAAHALLWDGAATAYRDIPTYTADEELPF